MKTFWIIYSPTEKAFWNNVFGWGIFSVATHFSTEEKTTINYLPLTGSMWLEIEEQFLPEKPIKIGEDKEKQNANCP